MKERYKGQVGRYSIPQANKVLMKDLVFYYAKQLGLNICYRCSKILERNDFTIDHTEPWRNQPNSQELFFKLENIRFSHHVCNSGHTRQPFKSDNHGHHRYVKGCRCDICKKGHRERISQRRKMLVTHVLL